MAAEKISQIDTKQIDNLLGIALAQGQKLVLKLFQLYQSSFASTLTAMRNANHKYDWEELYRLSHSLKSSSANLGLLALRERCYNLESKAKALVLSKSSDDLQNEISEILKVYDSDIRELSIYLTDKGVLR